jgi:protein O-mannosyl-transferase
MVRVKAGADWRAPTISSLCLASGCRIPYTLCPLHDRTAIRNVVLVCVALAAVTIAAYGPSIHAEFVNIDDPTYIAENLRVQRGITLENVNWAFRTFYFSNWHPLTWLSYMLDCELFGVNPQAMHRVNLGLHVANALLLFLLLNRLTSALGASAVVAALFALHPAHVESVAWIAERKDVLSTLFWMLTMCAYVEYVRRRCAGWYTASLIFLALGLMSKSMLVTLPFVLLLIDVWPMQRLAVGVAGWWGDARRLVLEKLPFFALAGVSSYLTFLAQDRGESVVSFVHLPLPERVENAIVSYVRYLGKIVWPSDLAVFYPHPAEWSGLQVNAAAALVIVMSVLAVLSIRRRPHLFCGWFWFVGTLVPVLGIIQVGGQSIADRYTYVPSIGLFVAGVWAGRGLILAGIFKVSSGLAVAVAIMAACAVLTWRQAAHWRNSLALFTHTEKVTAPNVTTLNNLGDALQQVGRIDEATQKFRAALKLDPENFWAWGNLGNLEMRAGRTDEAMRHYLRALQLKPNSPEVHYNLGLAFAAKRDFTHAVSHYEQALALNPFYLNARVNLGNAYLSASHPDAAATNYAAALQLKPDYLPAHYDLGNARLAQRRPQEAIKHFGHAIRLDPSFADAYRQLATALQQAGRPADASAPLERALALQLSSPGIHAQLGSLYADLGRIPEALEQYKTALKLDPEMPAVLNNLAWLLATHPDQAWRNGPEAVRSAERAVTLTNRRQSLLLGTLAAAYAEAGRFDDAVNTAQEAIEVAAANGQTEVVTKNQRLLAVYRERRPWREPSPGQ